jgi:hypothetical protein
MIEQLAINDIKEAYKESLKLQTKHAFQPEEVYYKVYSIILHIIHESPELLHSSNNGDNNEEDYVVKVWLQ